MSKEFSFLGYVFFHDFGQYVPAWFATRSFYGSMTRGWVQHSVHGPHGNMHELCQLMFVLPSQCHSFLCQNLHPLHSLSSCAHVEVSNQFYSVSGVARELLLLGKLSTLVAALQPLVQQYKRDRLPLSFPVFTCLLGLALSCSIAVYVRLLVASIAKATSAIGLVTLSFMKPCGRSWRLFVPRLYRERS